MKMRGVFALIMALGVVVEGCASGGGGGGGGGGVATTGGPTGSGANLLTQGARPRETDNTDAAEEALEAAYEALEAQNEAGAQAQFQAAMTASQAAITEDATNPLAYRLAGESALGVEEYEQAAQHLDRAVEMRPVYDLEVAPLRENAYINLYAEAIPLLQAQQYLEAAAILERANLIYPRRAEAVITLAQIYAQERQHDQAIEKIDEARAFLNSEERMAEVDSATAAQWREDGGNLLLMRGQVLADAGRFEEAIVTYREVAAEDPSNIAVQQDIAAILMTTGREDEAMAEYERLLALPGLSSTDYYRIGVGFYNTEDYGRASQAFERAAQASSRDRDAIEMWARSLALDSAYAAVAPVAERWIELDPSSQIALSVYAQATNSAGNAQQAAEIMRRAEALFVTVDDLEMRRGGTTAIVNGSVANRTLQAGAGVTLTFTFYNTAGQALGTATHQATVQAAGVKQTFAVEFSGNQEVAGYSYQVARS